MNETVLLYQKIKYLINQYQEMGGATTEDLVELSARLATDPEFLKEELKATYWKEDILA